MKRIIDKERLDMLNLYFDSKGHLQKREDYRTFVGLIRLLYKINKNHQKFDTKVRFEITLPIKWL